MISGIFSHEGPCSFFVVSDISQVDDLHEEYKLSFLQNDHHRIRQNNVESKQAGKPSIEEESISQLVEILKTEKEQKVCGREQ